MATGSATTICTWLSNELVAGGLRRLGYGDEANSFFDEHVLAEPS
jgi:hypothetical protein